MNGGSSAVNEQATQLVLGNCQLPDSYEMATAPHSKTKLVPTATSNATQLVPAKKGLVPIDYQALLHTYKDKKYYMTVDVAKIIGVTKQAVEKWRNKLYMGAPLFVADIQTHDGRYLYEAERVMQLKAVYRPNWTRGSYEPPVQPETEFGRLPRENLNAEYLRLIQLDIAEAQANLDNLTNHQMRGLKLETYRHFHCGYLPNWILTKSRAEYACGLYVKELRSSPANPNTCRLLPSASLSRRPQCNTSMALPLLLRGLK